MVLLFTVATKTFYTNVTQYFTHGVYRKTSNKIKFFHYSRWIQRFSKQMQKDTSLTACTKKLLIKLSRFYYSPWIHFFSKQRQDNNLLEVLYQNTSIETNLFLLLTADTMRNKNLLSILSCFHYSWWIQNFSS